jgi:chemotaxis protein methyltransferase CheR
MSLGDFNRLSKLIREQYGVNLPPAKKFLLESRLQSRLKALGMDRFHDYCDWVLTPEGHKAEGAHMMDLVTTNKTDFFREPHHFDFLQNHILPDYSQGIHTRNLKVWSAGCSSGEEPYTLAMVLENYAEAQTLPHFSVYATDISNQVLDAARLGIYSEDRAAGIPVAFRQKYLLKSKDRLRTSVRMSPLIRSKVHFDRLNLMQENYNCPYDFDIIFCRNVLIYFDKPTQELVIQKLCSHLRRGGFFFLGHSESTMNMNVALKQLRPTIFEKI